MSRDVWLTPKYGLRLKIMFLQKKKSVDLPEIKGLRCKELKKKKEITVITVLIHNLILW